MERRVVRVYSETWPTPPIIITRGSKGLKFGLNLASEVLWFCNEATFLKCDSASDRPMSFPNLIEVAPEF